MSKPDPESSNPNCPAPEGEGRVRPSLLYFGATAGHAIKPHALDYQNAAIHIHAPRRRADGPMHIDLFVSNIRPGSVGKVHVNFYCAPATSPGRWMDPRYLLERWEFKISEKEPPYLRAPVQNCIWTQCAKLNPTERDACFGDYYALVATLTCEATGQAPSELNPATDPCVAVFNSLQLPVHDCHNE